MKRNIDEYFEENKPYSGLGRESLHSGVILIAARCLNIFSQVASMVLLARLLTPYDFGLVALVLALIGFGPALIDLGTTEASTQKARITHGQVSTLFWLNIAIGGVLTILLAGCSSFIATLYGEPALTGIALVSSVTFILTALSNQHVALMRRAMQFRGLALIDISANVMSVIVGIAMAFTGWGYWSLVAKPILTVGFTTLGLWILCPWRPGRPQITPKVKEMVRFGSSVAGFTMTDYVARSADRLALGYFYGAGPLGYFQNAFLLFSNLTALLSDPLHNLAVSSLSKLRNDIDELKRSWALALSSLSFFSAAAFAVLAVTGQDFVVILLGQKWAPSGPLLSIFAVRGIAHGVERTLGWLHVSLGRTDRWMRWGLVSAVCQLLALAAGLPFGPTGVATTYATASFGLFLPAVAYAGAPAGIRFKDVLTVVGPSTAAGLIAVAAGFLAQRLFLVESTEIARFLVSGSVCIAAYLLVMTGAFRITAPLRLAFSVVRDFGPVRFRRKS